MLQSNVSVGLKRFSFMRMGIGPYGGETTKALVRSGWPDRGLVFLRKDLVGGLSIPAQPRFVGSTKPTLKLVYGSTEVAGVDEFLAAVYMSGSWALEVHVNGEEMPSLDGSALSWLESLRKAGLARSEAPTRHVVLRKAVSLKTDTWSAVAEPADSPSLAMAMTLERAGVGAQEVKVDLEQAALARELAPARRFGFHIVPERDPNDPFFDEEEEEKSRVVLDASDTPLRVDLRRSLVFDRDGKPENPDGLRFENEPVRHRALELLGCLSLLGAPLVARIRCEQTGTFEHKRLLMAMISEGDLTLVDA